MKKYMLIGLGCLAFIGMGAFSEAKAGVQVSINLGGPGPRPYYRPASPYYYNNYYNDCSPAVVYSRPVVVYGGPQVIYYSNPAPYPARGYGYRAPFLYPR